MVQKDATRWSGDRTGYNQRLVTKTGNVFGKATHSRNGAQQPTGMQTFWAGGSLSFMAAVNEWLLLRCCGKAGTDSVIGLGDLYTDDQEQNGK